MSEEIHNDSNAMLREILAKTLEVREDTVDIKRALWPDGMNQPGVLTKHNDRMDGIDEDIEGLVNWRNYLSGAWSVLAALFGIHWVGGGKH